MSRQLTFDLPVRTALGRGDFFVSPANAVALAALEAGADWPAGRMALVGPPASGKTHLAHVWAEAKGARLIDAAHLPGTDLPDVFSDPIALEGAEALAGDKDGEQLLFHALNLQAENKTPLLITARTAPARWTVRLPDLASRLSSLPVTRLEPPDDALLAAVLTKHFADRQLAVPDDVVPFLVTRMERSFEAAEALVERLDEAALTDQREITRIFAARMLDKGETGTP
ncbi:MAG: DnaA/Hda family protein [Pseudomonadota bacterium]